MQELTETEKTAIRNFATKMRGEIAVVKSLLRQLVDRQTERKPKVCKAIVTRAGRALFDRAVRAIRANRWPEFLREEKARQQAH